MPYYKRNEKCKQKSGKTGSFVTIKKDGGERKCWKSKAAFDRSTAARHANEADDPLDETDVMALGGGEDEFVNEVLLRNWVRSLLVEKSTYDPSCQYEIDINDALTAAGLRPPEQWPSNPKFCFGTSAGADAYFNAWDPEKNIARKYSLELKAGSGGTDTKTPLPHDVASAMLGEVAKQNTIIKIKQLLKADFSVQRGGNKKRGLFFPSLQLPSGTTINDVVVPDISIRRLAQELKTAQDAAISDASLGKTKGVKLYYFFARPDMSEKLLGVSAAVVLSDPDPSLVGSFEDHYTSADTNYVQIKGLGMFSMGEDPLELGKKLGVSIFSGNVEISGRYRFKAASSPTVVLSINDLDVEIAGQLTKVACNIIGRTFYFYARNDIKGGSKSNFSLDDEGAPQQLAVAVKSPELPTETVTRSLRRDSLLIEGGGRGDAYEETLASAFNESGAPFECEIIRGEYDLLLKIKGKVPQPTVKIEVKLGWDAQLGKFTKAWWKTFTYDKSNGFEGELKPPYKKEWSAVMNHILNSLNSNATVRSRMDDIVDYIISEAKNNGISWPGALNLVKTFETQLEGIKISWPSTKIKQLTSGGMVTIPPLTKILQWRDHGVNYVIMGNGPGSETNPAGWIGQVTPAPGFNQLGTMVPDSDVNVEVRWRATAKKGDPKTHSFSIDTRFPAFTTAREGMNFNNVEDLAFLLVPNWPLPAEGEDMWDQEDRESFDELTPDQQSQAMARLAAGRDFRSGIQRYAKSQVRLTESRQYAQFQLGLLKTRCYAQNQMQLLKEDLTGADKSEIKRMIKKEIEGASNRRETEKIFNKKFDTELRKALGVSFFGNPGKINKFVVDQIYDEVNKWLADTATRNEIADITKQVLIKLYRELSFSSPVIINRIKV